MVDGISPFDPGATFIKIGYYSFEDNQTSGYRARELKTVHLDIYCQYMKFVLY